MEPEQAKKQLQHLLDQAPKRADYPSEAAYQEATEGFRHRAGPSIRILRSLANLRPSSSRDTEK